MCGDYDCRECYPRTGAAFIDADGNYLTVDVGDGRAWFPLVAMPVGHWMDHTGHPSLFIGDTDRKGYAVEYMELPLEPVHDKWTTLLSRPLDY